MFVCSYVCACTCAHVLVHVNVCVDVCLYVYVCVYVYMCVCLCVCVCVCVRERVRERVYACVSYIATCFHTTLVPLSSYAGMHDIYVCTYLLVATRNTAGLLTDKAACIAKLKAIFFNFVLYRLTSKRLYSYIYMQ